MLKETKLPVLTAIALGSALLVGIRLGAQDQPRGGEMRRFSSPITGGYTLGPGPLVGTIGPQYYQGYFGTPWFIPQTRKYKDAYFPQYEFPKLGLQYQYPYAYQFGLQLPPETDQPIYLLPGYPPPPAFPVSTSSEGVALMKKGLYAEAGRRFAQDLGEDTPASPALYLLISEALFAVGKLPEADITLRQAIDTAPDLDFLARANLPGKFPSKEALDEKLKALEGGPPLLRGTFLILAGQGEKGLSVLRDVQEKDAAAKRVFLRFLGAAFGPEEEKKTEPQPKPKQEEKPGPR